MRVCGGVSMMGGGCLALHASAFPALWSCAFKSVKLHFTRGVSDAARKFSGSSFRQARQVADSPIKAAVRTILPVFASSAYLQPSLAAAYERGRIDG